MKDDVTNLYDETFEDLRLYKKGPKDVLWAGSRDGEYAISFDEFAKLAKDINYDAGFGSQEIVTDLVIVGKGWWMSRWEYDGSEGWEMHEPPVKQKNAKKFTKMHGEMWEFLSKITG